MCRSRVPPFSRRSRATVSIPVSLVPIATPTGTRLRWPHSGHSFARGTSPDNTAASGSRSIRATRAANAGVTCRSLQSTRVMVRLFACMASAARPQFPNRTWSTPIAWRTFACSSGVRRLCSRREFGSGARFQTVRLGDSCFMRKTIGAGARRANQKSYLGHHRSPALAGGRRRSAASTPSLLAAHLQGATQ
jgi:hypothetical protein